MAPGSSLVASLSNSSFSCGGSASGAEPGTTFAAPWHEPERILEIDWGCHHRHRYPVKLSLEVVYRPGVLHDIAEVVSATGINMRATHSSRSKQRPGTQR